MTESVPTEFHVDLRSDADAARIARRFVQAHSGSLPVELTENAQILVSELVTNAVLHGEPLISLSVNLDPPLIGVAVSDEGGIFPPSTLREPATTSAGGRGLIIVDRLASSWGVVRNDPPPGKTVWFRLDDDEASS